MCGLLKFKFFDVKVLGICVCINGIDEQQHK